MKGFWSNIQKRRYKHPSLGTPCWIWQGARRNDRYGFITFQGRGQSPHRVAWTLTNGDPGSSPVLHRCENPLCCNPDHLYINAETEDFAEPVQERRKAGRRCGAEIKKTKPTTVRFAPALDRWIKKMAERHPDGQSGVINDAVEAYREKVEQKRHKFYDTIVGSNGKGHGKEAQNG